MTTRPVTDEIAAVLGTSPEQAIERAIADTRRQHEAVSDISAEWGMILVEEIERLRAEGGTLLESDDRESRRVVRAVVAGLIMQKLIGGNGIEYTAEQYARSGVRAADLILAEIDRTEAHGS